MSTKTRPPGWQALSLLEEMFGYFMPDRQRADSTRGIRALDQMYAYYTRT